VRRCSPTATTSRRVARSTARWLLTDCRTDEGTFVSAFDADSEGEEGRFYVWPYDELVAALEELDVEVDRWTRFLGARPGRQLGGRQRPARAGPSRPVRRRRGPRAGHLRHQWERVRRHLLAHRARRIPPGVDHKALTDWNALAVRGLVRAGLDLDEPDWIAAAAEVAETLHDTHVVDGRLHHVRTSGRTAVPAFLDDLALLALADLELLQATGDPRWYRPGGAVGERGPRAVPRRPRAGGWFQTAHDAESLAFRPKDTFDNAQPSGTAVMIEVCLRWRGCRVTWPGGATPSRRCGSCSRWPPRPRPARAGRSAVRGGRRRTPRGRDRRAGGPGPRRARPGRTVGPDPRDPPAGRR
jgi:uncharacterized protein